MKRRIQCGDDLGIADLVDKRLNGKYSKKQARMLVEIGASCVEEDRNKRPTMDSIVNQLLEIDDEPKLPKSDDED